VTTSIGSLQLSTPIGLSHRADGGTALYDRNRLNQYRAITWLATETLGRRYESLTYDADGNLTASGLLAMDSDRDADVELVDFTLLQNCFNGPNRPPGPNCLVDADFDNDGDVDLMDFSVMEGCFNGPNP